MSEHGRNIKRRIAPGLWLDTDNDLHLKADIFLEWHGLPASPENIAALEDEVKQLIRVKKPGAPIIDLFELKKTKQPAKP